MGRDTIQLEAAVSTISEQYLLEFTSEYGIPESLHPEVPDPGETIVDFPEGKVGVYTRFFEFANYRVPLSQFLFDVLGHYQIHISQLSVIGAAKVSNFEISCRIHNIIPTINLFRVFYISSFNSGWMSFSKRPGKNTPQCYTKPLDSLKNWNNRFFWVDERIFPTVVDWRASAPKDKMPAAGSYDAADVTVLDTYRIPFQRLPEILMCLIGLSRRYYLGDDVYPVFLYDDDQEMDLFNLVCNPNPFVVKTGTRPRTAHEVPLLTATANRVINMEGTPVASESTGTPSTVEKSPLDFDNEEPPPALAEGVGEEEPSLEEVAQETRSADAAPTTDVSLEAVEEEEVPPEPHVTKRRKHIRRKRGSEEVEANAPPKVLRKDHTSNPTSSTRAGKSLGSMELDKESTLTQPVVQSSPTTVTDPEPLSYAKPPPHSVQDMARSSKEAATDIPAGSGAANADVTMGSPNSERSISPSLGGSPTVPPGYFAELRHMPNSEFLGQYNMNLARQVALGSQLRLRFEQESRLLKKATAKVARRDQRIQAGEDEIKKLNEEVKSLRVMETEVHRLRNRTQNLETLLEAEVDMKKAAEAKNADLAKELESLRTQVADLQVNNQNLSHQVSTLQTQVTGEEQIKAAFEEFKRSENEKVEQRCAEMDARLDALSIDFDEELYPHMLTAIAGRRWVIGQGLRLAILKCAESLELRHAFADVVSAGIAKGFCDGIKYAVEQGKVELDLQSIEAYDPEAENKFVATMQVLKDLKYPLVEELEKLKDTPMDIIMASLYLESDTGEDAPQWIRDLLPSSSQLKIPLYPKVCDPRHPWAVKEEMLLADAIAANKSRAEKKRKCRIVCCTHGIGSAHHPRSDGVPVSAPTVPQGLQILLKDAAVQTESPEGISSPRLIRSKSLPAMYNLNWP
ncbi:hypothetical protein Tco_1228117 [Tanacetum coccineum]